MIDQLNIDYKDLYNNAPCGYLCLSPEGNIIDVNNRFLEFTGYDRDEVIVQKKLTDFLSKAGKMFFDTNYQPILKMQGKIEEINFSILRKNDSRLDVLVNAVEVKNKEGKHVYTQATVFDISQRKSYESQLLVAKKEAEKLSLELKETNSELSFKNNLLESSIRYSQRIQYSILPPFEELVESFLDVFVHFQPKDGIGGDFYWCKKTGDYSFVAVIDCTGHGVPGALMSMSINSLLNEIMLTEDTNEPSQILGLLHEKVYQTFQQQNGDEYSQDGCDILICRLDTVSKELLFSGANSDLYVKTDNDFNMIHGTKKSIGGLSMLGECEPTRNFETVRIPYNPGSLIIMTTDGLLDQLDHSDEAFSISEFETMATKLYNSGTSQRKQVVELAINGWTRNAPQLDDILMIGFNLNH